MTVGRPDENLLTRVRTTIGNDPEVADTRAVILAGGRGARLAPYTSILPKPLMPIGDVPILELVILQLESCGIRDITLSVGYLSHLIRAVLGANGHEHLITYVQEDEPLGTAGPLRLIPRPESSFLVMNGDVLTTLDFRALLAAHRRAGNAMTVATHRRTIKIDYGVLDLEETGAGPVIRQFHEKPEIASSVSMGIYILEPHVLDLIPDGVPYDVPDLVHQLLESDLPVGAFPFEGMWFDIGRAEDHELAVTAWLAATAADEPEPASQERAVVLAAADGEFVARGVATG